MTGSKGGPPTLEEKLQKHSDQARRNAWEIFFGIVDKTVYQATCPQCRHKFNTKTFDATPAQLKSAAEFVITHYEGKAPKRVAKDPGKQQAQQIVSIVSHDSETDADG